MKQYRHLLYTLLIMRHFSSILLHNACSMLANYQQVRVDGGGGRDLFPVLRFLQRTIASGPLSYYGYYSGTATGYGFFAPQVGSAFALHAAVYDAGGQLLQCVTRPAFRTREAALRYQGSLQLFNRLLPAPHLPPAEGERWQRFAKALAGCIALRMAAATDAHCVEARVYVHEHVSLRSGHNGAPPPMILLHTQRHFTTLYP